MAGTRGAPGAAFTVELDGLESVLADLAHFQKDVKRLVNGELRREARDIARAALPVVRAVVAAGPAPQAGKMADTARAKSDRIPAIAVGAVNPRLSGFRRGPRAARNKGSLAWGVEKGPAGGPRRAPRNVYGGLARSGRGHAIGPGTARIADAVVPAYADALEAAMDRAGLSTRMLGGV